MPRTTNGALAHSHILIIGAGRLGTRVAERLCAAGVGRMTLCDYDVVVAENLAEQPLFTAEDIGSPKAAAAARRLQASHPGTSITAVNAMFSPETLTDDVLLLIDGTDNLETRLVLNDAARARAVPLVIATATKGRGMVFPVLPRRGAPCWQCISKGKVAADDCASGIEPAIADAVADAQARIALDILREHDIASDLLLIDSNRAARIAVQVNPACEACRGRFEHLGVPFSLSFCASRERVIARPNMPRVVDLVALRREMTVLKEYSSALLVSVGNGTALIHAHGQIEFSGVEGDAARALAERVLRVR